MKAADILMICSAEVLPSVCHEKVTESGVCTRLAYQTVEFIGLVSYISHDLLTPSTSAIYISLIFFFKFSERLVILSIFLTVVCKANLVASCKSWHF